MQHILVAYFCSIYRAGTLVGEVCATQSEVSSAQYTTKILANCTCHVQQEVYGPVQEC